MWDREETERSSSSAAQSVTCLPGQGTDSLFPSRIWIGAEVRT